MNASPDGFFATTRWTIVRAAGESAAEELSMDEGAVRLAVHRLRKRYREVLKEEIAHKLSAPPMVDEELAVLVGESG